MGRSRTMVARAAVAAAVLAAVGCDPPPSPWHKDLVSGNGAGEAASGSSLASAFSPDGTKIAFTTTAGDLGAVDTDQGRDLYLRDLAAGTTTLVSADPGGASTSPADVESFGFLPDGSGVVFTTTASDLGPTDTNGAYDLYLRDLDTGTTSLVSADASGARAGDGESAGVVVSPDGTRVGFVSAADDLGPVDTNGARDVYVRDLTTRTTTLVSVNAAGTDAGDGGTDSISAFSADGSSLGFDSIADDLGPTDTNGAVDAYVRNLDTGTNTLVSVNATGADAGNAASFGPVLSPDGHRVAFQSDATDLGPADTDSQDVYLRDLDAGTTILVSANASGTGGGAGLSSGIRFSPDGTRIAFASGAPDLVPTDTNGWTDIFLRDLATGTTSLVTANAAGTDSANGLTQGPPWFSPDGTKIGFTTGASDLGPTDTNLQRNIFFTSDVYVRDLTTGTATLVSARADGLDSASGFSFAGPFSPDGTRIAFSSSAPDMGVPDGNGDSDVFVATLVGADLALTLAADPDPVGTGGLLTYRLVATDRGPDGAPDATVALLAPEGTTVGEVPAGCTPPPAEQPRLVVCPLGDLAPGGSAAVTLTVTVAAPAGTDLTALAAVASGAPDPDGANQLVARTTAVA